MLSQLQMWLMLALSVGALVMSVWALIDALRRPAPYFEAAGRLTKNKWLIIVAIATVVTLGSVPPPLGIGRGPLGLLSIAAIVAAAVYLLDVRPAVAEAQNRSRGGGYGGGWRQ